jgi:ABC-type transporter Mla subunit MlaD
MPWDGREERLQIQIPAAKSDWRRHFAMMGQHHQKITELMAQIAQLAQLAQLAQILAKAGPDVTRAVESIQTCEKALNTRFQATISEYAAHTASLEQIEKHY